MMPSRTHTTGMMVDSQPVTDQDENMRLRKPRMGLDIGKGVPAALCAVLLALTALSGCSVFVVSSQRNPFLGEWHAEFPAASGRISYTYEFERDGSYRYVSASASGAGGFRIKIEGSYDYDDDTLILTPKATSVATSRLRYEFTMDDELQLESEIDTGLTITLTYHRHP